MKYVVLLFFFTISVFAQTTYIPTDNEWAYHYLDRLELKKGELFSNIHTSAKPYSRKIVATTTEKLDSTVERFHAIDRVGNFYLFRDNNEWIERGKSKYDKPLLKYFYAYKSDFVFIDKPDFTLKINPILHFEVMKELDDDATLFQNTRGIEIRGKVSNQLGFYTFVTENQARWSSYVRDYIYKPYLAIPNENRFGSFKGPSGVDYFSARGYITFEPIKHIQAQFGHDRHFIGNGERSLLLSDFAGNYFFLRFNTQVWKLHYTNIFMELVAPFRSSVGNVFGFADGLRQKKYAAIHHLSFNASKKLNIGIFESVIFNRSNGIELNYLNPVIFYRAVETQLGSPDNVLLGADFKWNFAKTMGLYGQVAIDEWNFSSILEQEGDWRNKQGFQLGLKTIDLFTVSGLDVQLEYNQVAPYTYAHFDTIQNYSHYNQPLAHPLGANFREGIAIVRYQTRNKINAALKTAYMLYGTDNDTINWGGNIFLDYSTREQDKGNKIGQGVENQVFTSQLVVSYQWRHNIFVDLQYIFRSHRVPTQDINDQLHMGGIGIRMNIGRKDFLF